MGLFTTAAQMRPIPRSPRFVNGAVSFWYRELGQPRRRGPLDGDTDYDVCVVGAGYTGLWTAYYLKKQQPDLRVAVVDRYFAGFGASGRNSGWLSAEFPGARAHYARSHGKAAIVAFQRALMRTVDEVVSVAESEGIDADLHKGGMLRVATNEAQRQRLVREIEHLQEWGYWPDDLHMIDLDQEPRIAVQGATAAAYSPHAVRIQPAKLVRGLADTVEALGVDLYEDTAVTEIRPRKGTDRPAAVTGRGTVRADHVVRATEGYTATMRGMRRDWLPMHASMIATEPVPGQVWERIGWQGREVLADSAHTYVYAQRTADDRIAIGGRGVPHRPGAEPDAEGVTQPHAIAELWRSLTRLLPDVADVPVEHAWSGRLGVTRDRAPTVDLDTAAGIGWAGGYAGSGVATSNLAGRTMCDLVLCRESDLTRLPWVGARARSRKPGPLHWVGRRFTNGLYRTADRRESASSGQTSRLAGLATRISGADLSRPGTGGDA